MVDETKDLLTTARDRFRRGIEADTKQAERERDDLAFYAGEQWPADVRLARQGQQPQAGMPAVPARPTLVINKVREPVRQVQNEIRDADIGIELTPADDFGDLGIVPDDTEIQLREGLVRRIVRDSDGQDAWNWAGDRANIAGRGYFAVLTRYLPGKTNDQEIYLHRIYNQAGVVGDPSRTEPDGSDADWWFVGTWVPWDRFKAQYPKTADLKPNPLVNVSDGDFMGLTEQYPDWYRAEGDDKAVRVTDYYYTDRTSRELVTLADGSSVWADEVPEGADELSRRTVVEPQIKVCKIGGGTQVLEETDWPSDEMPIIEVVGEELHPYDDQRRCEGMIRSARDAQTGFNYMTSKVVETIGLTPIPALQVDPVAIDGYESWYAQANTRAFPYLPSRTYDDQGRQLKEPHRPPVDPNILPMMQSLAMFDAAVKSTTAVPDPTLGNVDPTLKSGRAIRETVQNAKASTSNFFSNRVRSIRRAATVINSLLFPIYGTRPGRLVRVLLGTGEPQAMMVGDPAQVPPAVQQRQQAAKQAKLTEDARFNVAIKVTKAFDTRRQQEASMLGDLISAEPQLMTWFGDLYLAASDMPARKQLAERAKVMLAPPIQAMLAQQDQGQAPIPPAAQAQIAHLQQQVQQAEAVMQELHEEAKGKRLDMATKVQTEQIKARADLERVQLETDRQLQLERMKNATALAVARINAEAKGVVSTQTAIDEAIALDQQHAHEALQADLDREQAMTQHADQMAQQAMQPSPQGDGAGV